MAMATNTPLRKHEAKIQLRDYVAGEWKEWHDVWSVDPFMVPVDGDGMADGFDANLLDIIDAMVDWSDCNGQREFRIVWSDDESPVRVVCARCDDVVDLIDAVSDDLENYTCATVCLTCLS